MGLIAILDASTIGRNDFAAGCALLEIATTGSNNIAPARSNDIAPARCAYCVFRVRKHWCRGFLRCHRRRRSKRDRNFAHQIVVVAPMPTTVEADVALAAVARALGITAGDLLDGLGNPGVSTCRPSGNRKNRPCQCAGDCWHGESFRMGDTFLLKCLWGEKPRAQT